MDPSVEQYEESIRTLKGALQACVYAMEHGVDHIRCDHVDYWYGAVNSAKKLLDTSP